jgi:hypothetical protein
MRRICLTSLAAAGLFLIGWSAGPTSAAVLAPTATFVPRAIVGNGAEAPVHLVANICGGNGCVRVQTQRIQHHKPGSVAAKHI